MRIIRIGQHSHWAADRNKYSRWELWVWSWCRLIDGFVEVLSLSFLICNLHWWYMCRMDDKRIKTTAKSEQQEADDAKLGGFNKEYFKKHQEAAKMK